LRISPSPPSYAWCPVEAGPVQPVVDEAGFDQLSFKQGRRHAQNRGVVRKRLKLKLASKKVDGTRVYQIAGGADAKAHSRQPKHRAA
jgi:hypothetical protein